MPPSTPNSGKMDSEVTDPEANMMDLQSLKSWSESSEGSGVIVNTPAASQAEDNQAATDTPQARLFEDEAVHLQSPTLNISDWIDDTASTHSAQREAEPESAADMTLISHEETNSLGGSAYELIDEDVESSHGAETESISDCSVSRPSDVVSLADDEKSINETESEASVSHSAIPAYAGLDDNEDTPRVGLSTANVHNETTAFDNHDAQLQHIAFQEPEVEGVETASHVAVMHTVKEFSKWESYDIAKLIRSGFQHRLVGTIRQTMTKEYLSLSEPLRIIYVGSHQARQDILQKLGSSVAASRDDDDHSVQSSQLYNVVPISAFGSGKTPEVELTQSSAVQFKVYDLEKARTLEVIGRNPDNPNVLVLDFDHGAKVFSCPSTKKFEIRPDDWEKPHIAVFYCSDTDTEEMKDTLDVANLFMQRHNIPRIVISHKPLFDAAEKVNNLRLGHQPIHMCLESRDPAKPSNSIHVRLPIDLTSFLNIDARQMNRNLACITSLHEPIPIAVKLEEKKKSIYELPYQEAAKIAGKWYVDTMDDCFTQVRDAFVAFQNQMETFPVAKVMLYMLLSIAVGFFYGAGFLSPATAPQGAINNNGTGVAPIVSSISPAPISTSYSTTVRTTTITVTHAPKATGKVPENLDSAMDLISSFVTAELHGEREVVLRSTKANIEQLKKDANLAFRLWREVRNATQPCSLTLLNETLVWDKAAWKDNGVSILLNKADVHGSLKVGVESMTTDGRKIRKTYTVKLSKNDENALTFAKLGQCIQNEVIPLLGDGISRTFYTWTGQAAKQAHQLAHKSQDSWREVMSKFRAAQLKEKMALKMDGMKKIQAQIARQAVETERLANEVHKTMSGKLLLAQVKSRLIWLKRNKMYKEAKEYETKANKAGVFGKVEDKTGATGSKSDQKKPCPRGFGRKARQCRAAARV